MNTKTITIISDGGEPITVRVPCHIPTNGRAETLRALYTEYVKPLSADKHWKGPCEAIVQTELAMLVEEAMDFMGSTVDSHEARPDGTTRLYSRGYWAHGF
jgi:hypothetical protein